MTRLVVDTNVAIVAKGLSPQVPARDVLKAAKFLRELMSSGVLLIDNEGLIWREYLRHLNLSGSPTIGDEFIAWIHQVGWSSGAVERVGCTSGMSSILDALPPALAGFDAADHKWICVLLLGGGDEIVNAVDSDWANDAALLESCGVKVRELLA